LSTSANCNANIKHAQLSACGAAGRLTESVVTGLQLDGGVTAAAANREQLAALHAGESAFEVASAPATALRDKLVRQRRSGSVVATFRLPGEIQECILKFFPAERWLTEIAFLNSEWLELLLLTG
jgi:hypothetical protein